MCGWHGRRGLGGATGAMRARDKPQRSVPQVLSAHPPEHVRFRRFAVLRKGGPELGKLLLQLAASGGGFLQGGRHSRRCCGGLNGIHQRRQVSLSLGRSLSLPVALWLKVCPPPPKTSAESVSGALGGNTVGLAGDSLARRLDLREPGSRTAIVRRCIRSWLTKLQKTVVSQNGDKILVSLEDLI